MRDILRVRIPWFNPIARRVVVTGFCLIWGLVELVFFSPIWAMVFGGLGLYLVWVFFFDWQDPEDPDET